MIGTHKKQVHAELESVPFRKIHNWFRHSNRLNHELAHYRPFPFYGKKLDLITKLFVDLKKEGVSKFEEKILDCYLTSTLIIIQVHIIRGLSSK